MTEYKQPFLLIQREEVLIKKYSPADKKSPVEQFNFMPNVISSLGKLVSEVEYQLFMMVDRALCKEDSIHPLMTRILLGEGISFNQVFSPDDYNQVSQVLNREFDLEKSFVIGKGDSTVKIAGELGVRLINFSSGAQESAVLSTDDWREIYKISILPPRKAEISRHTNETKIDISLNLDGQGICDVNTGLGFFDHMLDQLGKHGSIDLKVKVDGDLHVDEHHTIEDTGLALGEAVSKALGDKRGIGRYGFLLPMDDCQAQVALDFGGRPWFIWDAQFNREKIGDMPTEMFSHFFKSFSDTARCNLQIKAEGENEHHKIEGIFKAWAKAMKMALERSLKDRKVLPSTKGVL